MGKRMSAERLEWWLKVQRDGKLGANFETLIRDFQIEREVVERVEALRNKYRNEWKSSPDQLIMRNGHTIADDLDSALEQPE